MLKRRDYDKRQKLRESDLSRKPLKKLEKRKRKDLGLQKRKESEKKRKLKLKDRE